MFVMVTVADVLIRIGSIGESWHRKLGKHQNTNK